MLAFTKMQGIGNDFVMLDTLRDPLTVEDLPLLSRSLNDRKFGIGGDGLILLERGDSAPFRMRMLNPDGSESEMCGNGVRCCARLIRDHGHSDASTIPIETGAGVLELQFVGDLVRVDMGLATILDLVEQPIGEDYLGTAVSMGNPHLVIFVDDVASVDLLRLGPFFEHHPFFPNRTNVHFAQVVDRTHLIQRTWERGARVTLACGTGACSVGVAAAVTGRAERDVSVQLPGGVLRIEYVDDGRVFMTGAAETVFEGRWGG